MLRSLTLAAAAVAALSLPMGAALAGPAETAFLQKLNNTWTGKGQLKGAESGAIACRIMFKSSGQKVNYQGRCTLPDIAAQAFTGSIVYNDAKKRYEVRSASGTIPGVRRGSSLVFTTKTTTLAGRSYSTMTVSASSLVVDFSIVDSKTGGKTTSHITFTR